MNKNWNPPIPCKPPNPKLIVRVTTNYWNDNDGIYKKRSIKFLKRKSINIYEHLIHEHVHMIECHEVIGEILNFDEVEDGVYELEICNINYEYSEGYSTGYLDSWNYRLVKHIE